MLTGAQQTLVEASATAPLYAVELQHSGSSELLSTANEFVFDGRSFQRGGVSIQGIDDARFAQLTLPFTSERVAEIQSGVWRGGLCKIWAIIADPDDPAGTEYVAADGYLRLDGRIQSSALEGDRIRLSIRHTLASSRYSPRHTYNNVSSFVAPSGTVIEWESTTFTLEPRR